VRDGEGMGKGDKKRKKKIEKKKRDKRGGVGKRKVCWA